jgi:hypothetical protein
MQFDVGVDVHNFTPITYEQAKEKMEEIKNMKFTLMQKLFGVRIPFRKW